MQAQSTPIRGGSPPEITDSHRLLGYIPFRRNQAMSDPSETSGRPLASNFPPSSEGTPQHPLTRRKRRRSSQSSDDLIGRTKSSSRRLGATREASGPHTRSSRSDGSTVQRSPSPTEMQQEVNYTRTGRISKAKKGLKVHHCECGRVSKVFLSSLVFASALPNLAGVAWPAEYDCVIQRYCRSI